MAPSDRSNARSSAAGRLEMQTPTPLPAHLPPEMRTLIQVTEMNARLERLFQHDQQHVAIMNRLAESTVRLEESGNIRAEKLDELERLIAEQAKWKDRLGGIWIGVGLAITTIASATALLKTFIK